MGFFKRLLSGASKRSKKASSTKKEAQDLRRFESQPLPVLSEVESEAAANRLLRSASSRLGAMHYNTGDDPLPPLPNPHPELDEEEAETRSLPFLPNPHPLVSPIELNSPTAFSPRCSVIDIYPAPEPKGGPTPPPRMTYTVKIHERTVISRTEFPNAIPSLLTPTRARPKSVPLPIADPDTSDDESIGPPTTKRPTITPRDQNRLLRLRQDPSVASLLNIYDSHGRLNNKAFSNSPVINGECEEEHRCEEGRQRKEEHQHEEEHQREEEHQHEEEHQGEEEHQRREEPQRKEQDQREEEQVYAVGRPQHQRRRSTLRQLMGKSEPGAQPNSSRSEGEISWAERFLQERNASSTSLTTASSSAGVRTPQDINFGQSQSYEDEHTTRQDYDSYQQQESVISSAEAEASANKPITDIAATTVAETYSQTPGRANGVFEFLTERRKQQESRPLPPTPSFSSRPSSISGSPSLPQEDFSLEPSQYVRVSQELSSISGIPRFNGDESSVFDPSASPTPIVGDSRIPRRIESRPRPKTSFDDRLLRNTDQADRENYDPFTAIPTREHRRKSSHTDADKALTISLDPARSFGNDVANGRSQIPLHRKALSAYENQENDWSVQGIAPTTPKRSRTVDEWYSAGGTLMPTSPASSTEMSPMGQQIMANVRRKRYGP